MNHQGSPSPALIYYRKNAEEVAAKRKQTYEQKKNGTYVKHERKPVDYSKDLITRRQAAFYMGMTQHKLTNVVNRTSRFNVPEHISVKGQVLYKAAELDIWKANNMDLFEDGMFKQERHDGIALSDNLMLIINWLQASKHVTKYCNAQRVAINSKQFWARWA
jgi:hypothetical protein